MHKIIDLVVSSSRELKSVRNITLLGMLGAISIVLGYYTIMPIEILKITFNFLPNEFVFYLFGPVVGAVYGVAIDILTFFIKPQGPFFYGFTVSAMLTGLIYGFALYKKPFSLKKIIVAKLIHMIIISVILNSYWLTILYGYRFTAIIPIRLLKAIILLPIETIILYTFIKGAKAAGIIKVFRHN